MKTENCGVKRALKHSHEHIANKKSGITVCTTCTIGVHTVYSTNGLVCQLVSWVKVRQ